MVKLISATAELQAERTLEKLPVGFVPTMGNLHQGHISLLEMAFNQFDVVYFSIFVNPKQFGPSEDFLSYPRTLENDLMLITDCHSRFPGKKVIVYSPKNPAEVFPEQADQSISVMGLNTELEGALRPGHFEGVATVVYRLFELIKPQCAYFGLKDYQQYLVIKQMVKDLLLPVEIMGLPIIRNSSGLALSSRNQYLSPEQKSEALKLSQTMLKIEKVLAGQKRNIPAARALIQQELMDKKWNYLEMRDAETLKEDLSQTRIITLLGVYQLGTTRLLDNLQVELT